VEARRNPVHTGFEELVGAEGEVRVALDPAGQAFVAGALWRAEPAAGSKAGTIGVGARVRVESVDGLTLMVRPLAGETDDPPQEGAA
jgi:membrane-bound ClpP family serine protease